MKEYEDSDPFKWSEMKRAPRPKLAFCELRTATLYFRASFRLLFLFEQPHYLIDWILLLLSIGIVLTRCLAVQHAL